MIYNKPALSFEEQADLIISRGMVVADRQELLERLACIGYYRLSAYWYPFRNSDDTFRSGTRFEQILRRYTFDRQLRCLLLDAIERVEVALKTQIVTFFSTHYGPFGYRNIANFGHIDQDKFEKLQDCMIKAFDDSKEHFVSHYREKYSETSEVPLWMLAEVVTYGNIFTFYRSMKKADRCCIADFFGVSSEDIFDSWLHTLNYIRNLCAHHARLWNRELAIKPKKPRKDRSWDGIDNKYTYIVILILKKLLIKCAPHTSWEKRLDQLLNTYRDIPFQALGIPDVAINYN